MVCTDRHPGDFHSVLSRARPAAIAGARDDARSGRRNAGVVYETDAARGGSRLHVCLSTDAPEKMERMFRANIAGGNAGHLPAAPIQSQLRDASRRLVRAESS